MLKTLLSTVLVVFAVLVGGCADDGESANEPDSKFKAESEETIANCPEEVSKKFRENFPEVINPCAQSVESSKLVAQNPTWKKQGFTILWNELTEDGLIVKVDGDKDAAEAALEDNELVAGFE